MKRLLAFIFIAFIVIAGLFAMSNDNTPISATDMQTIQLANRLYNQGDYDGAAKLYQSVVDSGVQNADVYYNLGNTYYQLGDYGFAVLNFTRAHQLQPHDSNIQHNLKLAKDSAGVSKSDRTPRFTQLENMPLTRNELALMTLLSAFVTVILWQARRITKSLELMRVIQIAFLVSLIWLAGSVFVLGNRLYHEQIEPIAIVVKADPHLDVPAGTTVEVLEQEKNQMKVLVPSTFAESWVSSDTIEMLS